MKKWIQLAISFVGSIIALLLAHYFNIFEYMTFIPSEKSYDVCITIYFTVIQTGVNIGFYEINKWLEEQKTKIEAVVYLPNEEPNLNSCPIIKFNEMDMAEIRLKLSVNGKSKTILDKKIIINALAQVDLQIGRKGIGVSVDNSGNIMFEMEKMCQGHEAINIEENYKLVLQRGNIDDSLTIIMKPKLVKKARTKNIKFFTNEAKIVLEER